VYFSFKNKQLTHEKAQDTTAAISRSTGNSRLQSHHKHQLIANKTEAETVKKNKCDFFLPVQSSQRYIKQTTEPAEL